MRPSSPDHLWAEARDLQAKGKLQKARKLLVQARKLAPGSAGIALELGVMEAQMGMFKHAVTTLRDTIRIAPNSPNAHYNLAEVLRAVGKHEIAVTHLRKTLQLDPEFAEAHFRLGDTLMSQGNVTDALQHLELAATKLPQDPEVQLTLAQGLLELEQPQRALPVLSKLVQAHDDFLDGHIEFLFGLNVHARSSQVARHIRSMEKLFDMDEVIVSFDNDDPASLSALKILADSYQASAMQERAAQIGKILQHRKSTRNAGALLLGTLAIQDGDFDAAEACFMQMIERDPRSSEAMYRLSGINRLKLSYEPVLQDMLSDTENTGASDRLYAGLALYRLLSRNDRPKDAFRALATAKAISAEKYPYSGKPAERSNSDNKQVFSPEFFEKRGREGYDGEGCIFVVGMMRSGTTLTEQILAAHSKVHAGGERDDMMSIVESLRHDLTKVPDLPPDWAAAVGKKLHEEMFKDAGDAIYATDKLPGNIDYAGLIKFLLPRARFVYCRRTPEDCALSTFEQNFSTSVRYSSDLKAIAHRYALHEDIAHYWMHTCPLDMFELDYDALVQDPQPNIRKLLDFAGLEFEEGCLYPNEVKREIRTASMFQVRQPISAKSVGRWRKFETELEPFTAELARLRKKLGLNAP